MQNEDTVQNNTNPTITRIQNQISKNPVLLYIKGSPEFPMCGFSARVVHILSELFCAYAFVNVLENPDIRTTLPKFANWPTFPQLYIQGELIGGCDIMTALHSNGELESLLKKADAIQNKPQWIEAE